MRAESVLLICSARAEDGRRLRIEFHLGTLTSPFKLIGEVVAWDPPQLSGAGYRCSLRFVDVEAHERERLAHAISALAASRWNSMGS